MIPGYSINESLCEDRYWQLQRCVRDSDELPVLIRSFRGQARDPWLAELLETEFSTLRTISIPGVLKAYDLVMTSDTAALVLEDPGGVFLDAALDGRRLTIPDILRIAIGITSIVADLHSQRIVHARLQPAVVLLGHDGSGVWITGFENALRLNERAYSRQVSGEGGLAYIAPEQTGRMEASVDNRTDLYSLGAIIYEMLTGKPPFETRDPLELVHCHLARTPQMPSELDPSIPQPLSDIVMRLLMTKPDERYKSAQGVLADLRECQEQYRRSGSIGELMLAVHDRPEFLDIPDRLYGRVLESKLLLATFDLVCRGGSGLVLVSGYSGVGKTSLIRNTREPVAQANGYFVSGKYDQLERSNPYSAILQAFWELVVQILTETDAEIEQWRQRILAALGVNARVIIEVIPELELIIGEQPPVPVLKPEEAQNRFNFYFRKFLAVFARPERPLVLFLDDLQWASLASIRLLQSWLSGVALEGLLMIGAYRDNEVDAGHPLHAILGELREAGVVLEQVRLKPLDLDNVNCIIKDAVGCPEQDSLPLARCVHAKTGGNPFFARSFLESLYEQGQLFIDESSKWSWNIEAITSLRASDNVVDLMAGKIARLPRETQDVIQLAACIGNRFPLESLATACDRESDTTAQVLAPALGDGLIEEQDDGVFTFYHDRIQEAAYGMIPEMQREQLHYQIGSLLYAGADEGTLEEQVFEIVNHLNLGSALIDTVDERKRLATLNLQAGLKAKTSTAYTSAHAYFEQGVGLLPPDPWEEDYELAFDLHRERSECAYLCGRYDEAEAGFDLLMGMARSRCERAAIYNMRIIQYENLSRYPEAAAFGREGLALFGITFPKHEKDKLARVDDEIVSIRESVGDRDIATLVHLPVMQDADVRMCMKLLMTMWAPTYISGDIPMTMLIAATMVRLSLRHGNTEESAYGYVTHAITVAARNTDYHTAYDYGRLALAVNQAFEDLTARAKVNHMFSCYICHWREHIKACFEYSRTAYEAGMASGDFIYAGYGGFHESWHALFSGMNLEKYSEEYSAKLQFLTGYKHRSFLDAHQLMLQWGYCLRGETAAGLTLNGNGFSETEYEACYKDLPFFIAFYYIAKLNIACLMMDVPTALRYAELSEAVVGGVRGMIWEAWQCFNHALVLAAARDSPQAGTQTATLDKLGTLCERMRVWADNAPQNYAQQYELIQAEIARLDGHHDEAVTHYERAITLSREHGFVNMEALANELAGRFWLQRGQKRVARVYLAEALVLYRRWGAHAKVRQLEARYGDLLVGGGEQQARERAAAGESLDVHAILKVSQAISGEMVVDRLVERLMQIVLENAGAERGVLLVADGADWRVEAQGAVDGETISVETVSDGVGAAGWSRGIVNYVSHTHRYLLADDAGQDGRLFGDAYIRDNTIRSVLCVPVLHQQALAAILYLENNLTSSAFTEDRVLLVQTLATQAAITLENARLYSDVMTEIGVRREAETALRVIASGTASGTGEDFFKALVQSLATSLNVQCVFVAECLDPGNRRVRTLALMDSGRFEDDIEYDVAGTPCECVVQGDVCYYPENLVERYPMERGFAAYMGVPAMDLSGRVLGHLAILDTTDMRHLPHAESILRIFATRVGTELHRKRTQEALQASEEKYRLLVENQTDMVVKLDPEGRLQFVSPSYCELFGGQMSELHGESFREHIHVADKAQVSRDWKRLLVAPWKVQFEHRALTAVGERWLGWALKAVHNAAGEVVEIVGVGRDVTDRRKAEEQARQNLHALTHAGRLQSMGEMASTLAHELNQPLTAILSFSQASGRVIMQDDYDREELAFALERIAVNAKRAGDIIRHMRSFIRKEEPHTESCNINQLIREAMDLVNAELLQMEIDCVLDLQEDLPCIGVDPVQIQQVILNLVRNSMEAIDKHTGGQRRIAVATRPGVTGGIKVEISDTGPGLNADVVGKIFTTFVTTKAEGMGIGLSICKSIIEAHGSELVSRPRPGGGVIFSFVLPHDTRGAGP